MEVLYLYGSATLVTRSKRKKILKQMSQSYQKYLKIHQSKDREVALKSENPKMPPQTKAVIIKAMCRTKEAKSLSKS